VIDVVPTLLETVGISKRAVQASRGGPLAPGKSLVPAFTKDGTVTHEYLWWHHEGHRAIRMGNWKLVSSAPGKKWSLYNMIDDRTETRDRAIEEPAVATRLQRAWEHHWEKTQELAKQGAVE